MSQAKVGRILVVEDDADISNMLDIYFSTKGYEVDVAPRGEQAMEKCRRNLPDLIVLDIMLPDMDGYAVCQQLRTTTRTSHIPIIFLTQKDERSDRIAGLELGADDYVTKPFDIEELQLRVKNAIKAHQRMNMTDPRTGLPGGRLIEEQLRHLMRREDWTFVLAGVDNLAPFSDTYGFLARDEVLRHTAMMITQTLDEAGAIEDFVGHAGGDTFTIITDADDAAVNRIMNVLRSRFNQQIKTHYNFLDKEQGGIQLPDGTLTPLMTMSLGVVSSQQHDFADIREITEMAAEARRANQELPQAM
jgi:diguanylate cyclase (GGDEF)-like protein